VQTALAALVNAINAGSLKATIRRAAWQRGWDEEPEEGEEYAQIVTIRDDDAAEAWGIAPPLPRRRSIIYRVSPDWGLTTVTVADLKSWLVKHGRRPAFFFREASDTPDYLDPDNPRYAAKMPAAIRAWQAVADPGKKTPKQALDRWLPDP
jgi:hypothetical protein